MKKLQRILSLLLVLVMLCGLTSSCSCQNFSFEEKGKTQNVGADSDGGEKITRGQWAKMLGDQFGLDSCLSMTPYYEDVDATNQYFIYIQSGAEWQIYSLEDTSFKPDEYATTEFILETSMKAAELAGADVSTEEVVDMASDKNLIVADKEDTKEVEEKLQENPTAEYAELVAEWAKLEYQNKEVEEYIDVVVKDTVIDMMDTVIDENGSFTASTTDLKAGDVIMTAPTKTDPAGVARKVTEVTYDEAQNAVVMTEQPSLEDVFEALDFAYSGAVTEDAIVTPVEGVTAEVIYNSATETGGYNSDTGVELLGCEYNNVEELAGGAGSSQIKFAISLGSDTAKFSTTLEPVDGVSLEVFEQLTLEEKKVWETLGYTQLDNFKIMGDVQTVKSSGKYDGGWTAEGSLVLKNLNMDIDFKTKKVFGVPYGIESYDYKLTYDVETTLQIEGKLESAVKVGTVDIPLGTTGLSLQFEVFISTELNGEVKVTAKMSTITTASYSEYSGKKCTSYDESDASFEMGGSAKAAVGGKVIFKALGINLIDIKAEFGIGVDANLKVSRAMKDEEGNVYKYSGNAVEEGECSPKYFVCGNVKAYYPIITVSSGMDKKTLAGKIGLKLKIKVMDKSGAPLKSHETELHYEYGKWVIDCSCDDLEVYVGENETTTEELTEAAEVETSKNESILNGGVINISEYGLSLNVGDSGSVSVISLPAGYEESDLVWSVTDDEIAKVSSASGADCTVTALSGGSTYLVVTTSDGKYSIKCAIRVSNDEDISFTPL